MIPLGLLEAYGTVGLAAAAAVLVLPADSKDDTVEGDTALLEDNAEGTRLLAAGAAVVVWERRIAQRTEARNLLILLRG